MIAYKLFKVKKKYPGQLFPLYVMANEPVPIGVWLPAKEGPRNKDGKVSSKLGPLAFRPGWHLSDIPLAIHIGQKENGKIKYMHDDEVWCECECSDAIDYSYIKRFFFFKKHIVFPQEPVFMGIHVIKATCSQCKKEITVFDSRYHGYDSQFTSEEQKAYVPHFENSKERVGKITITMEQYAEEDVVPEHFSWIQIFVVNGDKRHTFFDAETG